MTDLTTAEPSAEELAAAQAVLARKAAADQSRVDAAAPALKALVVSESFPALRAAAEAVREQLAPGTPLHQHLTAMIVGMTNLQGDVARLTPAA